MKKLKRIIASASAAAMAASALLAAVPASAASVEKEIAYTGPSEALWLLKTTVHRCV